jgi:hypothetical protein
MDPHSGQATKERSPGETATTVTPAITAAMLFLDPIPVSLRPLAVQALHDRVAWKFFSYASNEMSLLLLVKNQWVFQSLSIYEQALLEAYIGTRTNNSRYQPHVLRNLFAWADRARLRAAGDPLPGVGPYTLYRGVAGRGAARRLRGFSWTASYERAVWFAERGASWGLPWPAVYQCAVPKRAVLAYTNEREEEEFLVALPRTSVLQRVRG